MAQNANYLALDLGAESGRAIVGTFDGKILALREIHRFPNAPVKIGNRMHWDALRLFAEMKAGLKLADMTDANTLASVTDQDIFNIIRNGKDKMPAEDAGRAKDNEVWNIVIYLRNLSKPAAPAK